MTLSLWNSGIMTYLGVTFRLQGIKLSITNFIEIKLYYLLVSTLHFYANVKESYITHKLSILKTPILISRNVFIIPVFY